MPLRSSVCTVIRRCDFKDVQLLTAPSKMEQRNVPSHQLSVRWGILRWPQVGGIWVAAGGVLVDQAVGGAREDFAALHWLTGAMTS